jgi:hypothetical protein
MAELSLAQYLFGVAVAVGSLFAKELFEYSRNYVRFRRLLAADIKAIVDSRLPEIEPFATHVRDLESSVRGGPSVDLTMRLQWDADFGISSSVPENLHYLNAALAERVVRFYEAVGRAGDVRNAYNDSVVAYLKSPDEENTAVLPLAVACAKDLLSHYREMVWRGSDVLLKLDPDVELTKYEDLRDRYRSSK